MVRLRRALGRIAIAWCLCQLTGMTVAPTILWALGAEAVECTCTHDGDHSLCPMHHPRTATRHCVMDAVDDNLTGALIPLSSLAELVLPSADIVVPQLVGVLTPHNNLPLLVRPVSPYLPPPRR